MTTHSLTLSPHEVLAALRGELGLVIRPVKPQPTPEKNTGGWIPLGKGRWLNPAMAYETQDEWKCPLGVPGDRLVCRETFYIQDTHGQHRTDGLRWGSWSGLPTTISPDGKQIAYYKEGFDRCAPMWRSPATMPAWASRITLEVVGVRCVRIVDLVSADIFACGFGWAGGLHEFWIAKYGTRYPWETSWAWAVEVRRVEG